MYVLGGWVYDAWIVIIVSCLDRVVFFFLMIRRPPRSTRTDTLFPYTTLFRSGGVTEAERIGAARKYAEWALVDMLELGSDPTKNTRSEEHTSELQSLMRISYAVFCLKKKNKTQSISPDHTRQHTNSQHTHIPPNKPQHLRPHSHLTTNTT